ncbi:MAG: hypothetical protein EAZ91_06460 [Cytophagales bacterium]|nr:MAG: hypothetical protein EAZ91_06460 [Cytophagales bacterium]
MQKYLFFLIIGLLWVGVAQAQPNLNRIEYFVDTDPGFGAATLVPGASGTAVADISFDVPLTGVSAGFHRLFIRARNANNQWSVAAHWPFFKDAIAGAADLSRIEYFVDADPGFGAGTNVPFTTGTTATDVPFILPLDNTSVGFHNLFVRAQTTEGRWSVVARRPFYKDEVNQQDIVRLEYFIDTDPGYGAATSVAINRGPTLTNLDYTVDLNGVTNGPHRLFVRAQNAQGRWSVLSVRDFTVQDNVIVVSGPTDWCRNTAFNIGFIATGTYNTGNIFTVQLSNPTGSFLSGVTTLATVNSLSSTALSVSIPNSVALGSGYRLRVVSSNPNLTNMPDIPLTIGGTCVCTTLATVKAGDWGDQTVWTCNRIPGSADAVRLRHLVRLPSGLIGNVRSISYDNNGSLRFGNDGRLRVGF